MSHENENEILVGRGGGGGRLLCQLSLVTLSSSRAEAKIFLADLA